MASLHEYFVMGVAHLALYREILSLGPFTSFGDHRTTPISANHAACAAHHLRQGSHVISCNPAANIKQVSARLHAEQLEGAPFESLDGLLGAGRVQVADKEIRVNCVIHRAKTSGHLFLCPNAVS